jgi:hypothetical protein
VGKKRTGATEKPSPLLGKLQCQDCSRVARETRLELEAGKIPNLRKKDHL